MIFYILFIILYSNHIDLMNSSWKFYYSNKYFLWNQYIWFYHKTSFCNKYFAQFMNCMINDLISTYFLHFCTHLSSYVHPGMFSIYQLLTTQKYAFYAFRKGGGIQDIFVAKILMHKMKILFTSLHILLHSFLLLFFFHKCTKTLMKYAVILWMQHERKVWNLIIQVNIQDKNWGQE